MKKKMLVVFTVALCLVLSCSLAVFAEGGNGSGGGNGGGGSDGGGLTLDSSSVIDGATDVTLNPEITLIFSNNVVNIKVAEDNKGCFSLNDASGNAVAIEVEVPDDQLEPDRKRDIVVKAADLKAGESYTLVISPDVSAKNGNTLGKEVKISFTTAAEAAPEVATVEKEAETAAEVVAKEAEAEEIVAATVAEEAVDEVSVVEEAIAEEEDAFPLTAVLIVVVFLVVVFGIGYFFKRKNNAAKK